MEKAAKGEHEHSSWDKFKAAFKVWFKALDEATEAKDKIWSLYQGKKTVKEYYGIFAKYVDHTY